MTKDDIHFMTDEEYAALQQQYGGRYVARRGTEVIASARSLGDLIDRAEAAAVDWTAVVIEYVERPDRIRIHAH